MAFDSSPRAERTGRPGDRIAALRLILDKIVSARGRLTHDLGNLSEFAEPALDLEGVPNLEVSNPECHSRSAIRVGLGFWFSRPGQKPRTKSDPCDAMDGFADFSPFVVKDAQGRPITPEIQMEGNWGSDLKQANQKASFGDTDRSNPVGTTWHHSQDRTTMMLVPTDIHDIRHTGGVEMIKRFGKLN